MLNDIRDIVTLVTYRQETKKSEFILLFFRPKTCISRYFFVSLHELVLCLEMPMYRAFERD